MGACVVRNLPVMREHGTLSAFSFSLTCSHLRSCLLRLAGEKQHDCLPEMNSQRIRLFILLLTWASKPATAHSLSLIREPWEQSTVQWYLYGGEQTCATVQHWSLRLSNTFVDAHQIVMTRGLPPMLGAAGAHSRRQCRHLSTPLGLHVSCQNSWGPCAPLPACSHESSNRCVSHVRIRPDLLSNLDRLQGCVLLVRVDRTHVRHHLHAAMQSWVARQASLNLAARGGSLLLKCKGD